MYSVNPILFLFADNWRRILQLLHRRLFGLNLLMRFAILNKILKRFISDEVELCCENVFHVYRSSIQMVFPKYWNDVKLEKEKSLQIDFSVSIDKIDFRSTITKNVIRSWEEAQVCFIFDDPRKAWKFLIFHSLKPFLEGRPRGLFQCHIYLLTT